MSTNSVLLQQVNNTANVADAAPTPRRPSAITPQEVDFFLPARAVVSLDSLAIAYVIVLNALAETLFEHTSLVGGEIDSQAMIGRRREICAAVWAANRAALEASNLTADERARLNQLVWRRLHVHWQIVCGPSDEGFAWLESRSSEYLHAQPHATAVTTANHIVKTLFDAIGVKHRSYPTHSRVVSSLVGHRIVSEVNHLNELKAQFRFV